MGGAHDSGLYKLANFYMGDMEYNMYEYVINYRVIGEGIRLTQRRLYLTNRLTMAQQLDKPTDPESIQIVLTCCYVLVRP